MTKEINNINGVAGKTGQRGDKTERISVVLPAYNEENAVAVQIENIRNVLSSTGIEYEIVVVDDGSQDRTAERALKANARVVRHYENRGYGAALKTGISAAEHEIIVISDADGTYPADQIPALVEKLENADMVVGSRTGKEVSIPLIRRPAKWMLGLMATMISGRKIPDLNSGMRAFRRSCVEQYFSILPNSFSFTTTVTLALLADNYHIIYYPINYFKRVGNSKIVPWHFVDFTILVLRLAMLFQPLKIFVPLSFLFAFLGISKVAFDIVAMIQRTQVINLNSIYQHVLSTSAILMLLTGLQLLLIGMVADAVLRRIARDNKPLIPSYAKKEYRSGSY